jgi:phage recombination protein Bet
MEATFSEQEVKLLVDNKIIPANADRSQIAYFFEICKRKKLDPFLKHVHMIERNERDPKHEGQWLKSYTIQTSLDGMRVIAQRNVKIISYKRWTKKMENEIYGCCEISTEDRGLYSDEVPFSEYVGKTKQGEVTKFWKQFPQTMIKKVAEESVLRMLCPEDLSGVFGDDEMDQAENPKQLVPEKPIAMIPEKLDDSMPVEVEQEIEKHSNEFEPAIELITFGKHSAEKSEDGQGKTWAELPMDYLEWLLKSEKSDAKTKEKAKASIEYKKSIQSQIADPMDKAFGKKEPVKSEPAGATLIGILQDELNQIARTENKSAIEEWWFNAKPRINKLQPKEKSELLKAFTEGKKCAK